MNKLMRLYLLRYLMKKLQKSLPFITMTQILSIIFYRLNGMLQKYQ